MTTWNPRYVRYAESQGRTPEEQAEEDDRPGAMTRYVAWINARWREWCEANGVDWSMPKSAAQHAAFDAWLDGSGR